MVAPGSKFSELHSYVRWWGYQLGIAYYKLLKQLELMRLSRALRTNGRHTTIDKTN